MMDPALQKTIDEMKQLAEELRQEAKRLRNRRLWTKWNRPTVDELLEEGHKWEAWYAWHPVTDIHGVQHWLKNIYRVSGNTYVDRDDWSWYHYGTVFDVLKANQ